MPIKQKQKDQEFVAIPSYTANFQANLVYMVPCLRQMLCCVSLYVGCGDPNSSPHVAQQVPYSLSRLLSPLRVLSEIDFGSWWMDDSVYCSQDLQPELDPEDPRG